MTYKKILFFVFIFSIDANQSAVVLAGEALFKKYTTTPKIEFYVLDADKKLATFYAQGGTLKSSGKEGIAIMRLSIDGTPDTVANAQTLRSYELPAKSGKLLILGYTNFPDPFNYLGAIVAGTQNGTYALLREEGTFLKGGCNWGWRADMSSLQGTYWANATVKKIFTQETKGNVVAYSAKGEGVYYVHRGINTSKITDTLYRFVNRNFLHGGIAAAVPMKLIVSGINRAPKSITAVEVIQYAGNVGKEQLLIGSNEGVYITTVPGGIQQVGLTSANVTFKLIDSRKNLGIKYFSQQEDGSFNIVGRINGKAYITYNVSITLNESNETNPTISFRNFSNSTLLPLLTLIKYPDMVTQFENNTDDDTWIPD
jgi:hypothetical protein